MAKCKICGREILMEELEGLCDHCDYLEEYALPNMPLKGLTHFFERIHLLIEEKGKRKKFIEAGDRANKSVSKWPSWKQNVLGSSMPKEEGKDA